MDLQQYKEENKRLKKHIKNIRHSFLLMTSDMVSDEERYEAFADMLRLLGTKL